MALRAKLTAICAERVHSCPCSGSRSEPICAIRDQEASCSPRHYLDEALEQIMAITRTGTRLGMVLHRKCRPISARQPLIRTVEQRYMRHLCGRRQRFRIDGKAVIL